MGWANGAEPFNAFDSGGVPGVGDGNKASIPPPHHVGTVPGFWSVGEPEQERPVEPQQQQQRLSCCPEFQRPESWMA
jgi:hypothetical protein